MKICLDPGHGGYDQGADGPTGLNEAPVVLEISQYAASDLIGLGHQVKLTRTTDVFVELSERCEIANEWGADLFISVHCNSNGPEAQGVETLYATEDGLELAIPIQDFLVSMTKEQDRGVKERNDLWVLNGTNMPAVLVEVGFISNPDTEQALATQDYKVLLAQAIVAGVSKFLVGGEPGLR